MINQISIKNSVKVNGLNIYNGNKNSATFHPAEENSGLVFIVNKTKIPAKLELAKYNKKAIGINNLKETADLTEHLLSAVYGLEIDNMYIELSDGVCPATDNCAREYFDALKNLRIEQKEPKKFWKYAYDTEWTIKVEEKPDSLTVKPAKGFFIDSFAYYPHKVVGEQEFRFNFNEGTYDKQIADARSPCFTQDILSKKTFTISKTGINEKNFLLIGSKDDKKYLNHREFGVRYRGEEFVRHKVLDFLGTLALTGRHFIDTEFNPYMTGHKFDLYALKKLFEKGCFVGA